MLARIAAKVTSRPTANAGVYHSQSSANGIAGSLMANLVVPRRSRMCLISLSPDRDNNNLLLLLHWTRELDRGSILTLVNSRMIEREII